MLVVTWYTVLHKYPHKYDSHAFPIPQGLCLGASLLTFYDLTVQAMVKISGKIRQMKGSK